MDFINRGMLFAAVLLLCFFPFLIIVNALAGQTAATGLIRHLGLNQEAAAAVSHLGGLAGSVVRGAGGPVLLFAVGVVVLTAFWWFTMWLLLAGRIWPRWRGRRVAGQPRSWPTGRRDV